MTGKVKCTCGWSWNKSDSSKKDMYICHECGRDNSNNIPKAQEGIKSPNVWAQEQHFQEKHKEDKDYKKFIGNTGEEIIDFTQHFIPGLKYFPGIGSAFAVGEAEANNQNASTSDELGVVPFWPAQAASLMLLDAEVEKENMHNYAKNKYKGKDLTELVPEQEVNNKVIDKTYVPKPKIGKLKETKSKKVPYKEQKEVNKVEIDNTHTNKPRVDTNYKPEPKPETKYKFTTPNISYRNDSFVMPEEFNDIKIDNTRVKKPIILKKENGGWLDNYNDYNVSAPKGMEGDGYSNVGRNSSPAWGGQFQNGGKAQQGKQIFTKGLEDHVNDFLGHPQDGAFYMSDSIPGEAPVDSVRHSFAGRYTQDAIAKRLGNGVIGNVAGVIGSNLMGAAHELGTMFKDKRDWPTKLRESGEDMVNNAIGSVVGAIPYMDSKAKDKMMLKMAYGNLLPDGYVATPEGMKQGLSDNIYFKNQKGEVKRKYQMGGNLPGAVGNMYARTGSPSKGPRRNQTDVTDASAQNGKEMQYYQNGLDWKPKSISKNGAWLDNYKEEIIKDDRGQWDYPGEITRIKGGDITMKRDPLTGKQLTQPLLGIADTGEQQMMYPGEDYNFEGANYVTEYPMAQNGIKLDLSSLPKVSDFKKKKLEIEPEKNTVVKESTKINKNIPTKVKQVKQFEPLDDTELAKLNVPDQVYSQIYQAQQDKPEQNYGVVDKENNVMYFVDTYGDIVGHENVITGATNKDKENAPSMKEYGKTANEYYDYLKNTNQRVTPAGIFTLHSNKNNSVGKPHSLVDRAISTLPFADNVRLNTLDDPSLMHAIYNEMPWREENKKEYYDHRKESYGPTGNMFRMTSQYGVPSSKGVHGTGNPNRISALNTPGADKNLSNGCINVGGRTICNDVLKDNSKLYILPEKKYMFGSKEIATNKKDIYPAWGHTDDSGKYIPTKDRNISREDIQSAKATRDKVMGIIKKNKINATPEEIDFISAVAEKETKGGKSWMSKAESILPGFSSYGLYEQKESFPYLNGKSPNDEAASTKAVLEFYRDKLYNNPDLEYDKFKNEEIYSMYNTGKENTDKGIHLGDEFRKILQSVKEYKNGGSINQQDQKTLQQLDQLTNFTNYNKPQPGGWLNKYKS